MKTHTRSQKVIEAEDGRPEFLISSEALVHTIQVKKTKTGYTIGYLMPDSMAENPIETDDGMGRFVHWKDHGHDEYRQYCRLRGMNPDTREPDPQEEEDPDAVLIDKYEHSGVAYSVSGEGTRCAWDTSSAWAVWVPDEVLLDEMKKLTGKKRYAKCVKYARQACETINMWFNGDVYGVIVKKFDQAGQEIEETFNCWGFFGEKYALEELTREIGV